MMNYKEYYNFLRHHKGKKTDIFHFYLITNIIDLYDGANKKPPIEEKDVSEIFGSADTPSFCIYYILLYRKKQSANTNDKII